VFIFSLVAIFIIVFFLSLLIWTKRKRKKEQLESTAYTTRYSNKITVSFDDCEVKTREYFEESVQDDWPTRIQMLDALGGRSEAGIKEKRQVSIVLYKYVDENGQIVEFRSSPIYMPGETLRFRLLNKKSTILYFDQKNNSHYYFDFDFLFNESAP
jgi:hypothetical protein